MNGIEKKDLLSSPNVTRAKDFYNSRTDGQRMSFKKLAALAIRDKKPDTADQYLQAWDKGQRLSSYRHYYGLEICRISGLPQKDLYRSEEN